MLLCAFSFIGCSNNDKEGRKVTNYKELVLTAENPKGYIIGAIKKKLKEL